MTQLQTMRHFLDAANKRNWHYVVPEEGTPFEAILDPGYWAHVAAQMAPGDWVEVDAEDGSYTALLKVRDAGKLYAKLSVFQLTIFDEKVEVMQGGPALAGHVVKWRGPVHKWCVLRGADVLIEGLTKDAAYAWLGQYSRTVG